MSGTMESNGQDYVESGGTGVMVSNLPLLFTRGFPSSLQQMKLDELEDFVPFMVRCSLGEENPVPWSQLPRPTWWPRKLPFRIPSGSTPAAKRTALISLVERCYSFHGCEYLLQFCASLLETMPSTGYRFNDNRDGTTSMYHGTTGKLLVTFRNENRDYDKSNHDLHLRKKLLLSPTRVSTSGTTTAVFQPAATDIYLCDKCENEFESLREVQIHEKKCCGETPPSPIPPSPDPEPVDEEPEPAGQVPFLAYFKLQPAKHTGLEPYMSPRKRSSSPPRKLFGPMFPRFDSVPLASPLGKFLLANSKLRNKYQASQHLVIRYERHLHATPHTDVMSSRERCNNRWIVVWRPNKEEQPWCHLYCFTRAQRRERSLTIQTGLNWRSRRLLSLCRPLRVNVKRLQKRIVDRVMRLNGPTAPCIDLTDEPQRGFADVVYPENILPDSSSFGMTLNGAQKLEDPLRLFYSPSDMTLNLGASSSSCHTQDDLSRSDGLAPPLSDLWNGELLSMECDPLMITPSDNIQHDSISLLPPSSSYGSIQNHLAMNVNSSVGHGAQCTNNEYDRVSPVGAPGPKCSKIGRQALLPANLPGQQDKSGYVISNRELVALSQGNFGVLNRLCDNVFEAAPTKGDSSSPVLSISRSDPNQSLTSPQNPGNSLRYHAKNAPHSVPQVCENNGTVVLQTPSSLSQTEGPLPSRDSSIEVIELSSDDDEVGRVWNYSETDHTPHQLDGLACYPHSGAKVPDSSSQVSMPKNGSSHWSSDYESHCDAGRVGDLATNGQPPVVLKNPVSPVPTSPFLLGAATTPVQLPATARNYLNSRKRRCEDPPLGGSGGKLKIIDISSQGLKVLSQKEVAQLDFFGNYSREKEYSPAENYSRRREYSVAELFVIPSLPQGFDSPRDAATPTTDASLLGSNQSGAFVNNSIYQNSLKRREKCSSEKQRSHYKRNSSIGNDTMEISSLTPVRKEPLQENYMVSSSPEFNADVKKSSGGLLNNIVNTVSKGVEFICSLVASSATGEEKSTSVDKHPCPGSRDGSSDLDNVKKPLKTKENNEDLIAGKTTQVPRVSEVQKLLQDECRELHRNGLGDLRFVDLQDGKLTRKYVERVIPSRVKKKRPGPSLKDEPTAHQGNADKASLMMGISSNPDDISSACMDENGNSPSYIKIKLKGQTECDGKDNNTKQSDNILRQIDSSNNNNIDINDSNSLEQPASKEDNTFTGNYSFDICANRAKLKDCDYVNNVNSKTSQVTNTLDVEFGKGIENDDLFVEKGSVIEDRLKLYSNDRHESPNVVRNESGKLIGRGMDSIHHSSLKYNKKLLGNGTFRVGSLKSSPPVLADVGSRLVKARACSVDKYQYKRPLPPPFQQTSGEVLVNSKTYRNICHTFQEITCSRAVTGKTAEECGSLQARIPSSDRSHSSMQNSALENGEPPYILQNTSFFNQRPEALAVTGESSGKKKNSSCVFSEVQLNKLDTSRVSGVLKNLSVREERERGKKGFQSSLNRNSSHEGDISGGNILSSVGSTRIRKLNMAAKTFDHNGSVPSDGFMQRTKKINYYISGRELASLGEDEWKEMQRKGFHPSNNLSNIGQVICRSGRCDSVEEEDDDIENMPMYDSRLQGKTVEKISRALSESNTTVEDKLSNTEVSVQTSQSNCKFACDTSASDSFYRCDRLSMRESGGSQSRNFDGIDRRSDHSGRFQGKKTANSNVKRKLSLSRELSNLGKDEWKEMRKSGFHPSKVMNSTMIKEVYSSDESNSDVDSDVTENEPLSKRIREPGTSSHVLQKRCLKNGTGDGETWRTKAKSANLCWKLRNLDEGEEEEVSRTALRPSSVVSVKQSLLCLQDKAGGGDQVGDGKGKKTMILSSTSSSCSVNSGKSSLSGELKKPRKKSYVPRELLNLGKDEWKEMKNTGFHPADLVGSKHEEVTYFFGESDEEEDSIENKPPPPPPKQVHKLKRKKVFSREVASLLKDECKELKQCQRKARSLSKQRLPTNAWNNQGRQLRREEKCFKPLLMCDKFGNSDLYSNVLLTSCKSLRGQSKNQYANARSTRSQTNVVSLVEVFTPRDTHRQLLQTETAMCVLNFDLPLIS